MGISWRAISLCALLCAVTLPKAGFGQVRFLQQNWDDATRQLFYPTSQGYRLIPFDWFLAREVSYGN